MKKNNNYTKGQWTTSEGMIYAQDDCTGKTICTMNNARSNDAQADAQRIVTAVNSHDKMVTALAMCMEHFNSFPMTTETEDSLMEHIGEALEGIDIYETLND
jgi:hypothetical protein